MKGEGKTRGKTDQVGSISTKSGTSSSTTSKAESKQGSDVSENQSINNNQTLKKLVKSLAFGVLIVIVFYFCLFLIIWDDAQDQSGSCEHNLEMLITKGTEV